MSEWLTFAPEDVNSPEKMAMAIAMGSLDHVEVGIARGLDTSALGAVNGSATMLHVVVANNRLDILKMFLDSGHRYDYGAVTSSVGRF